MAEILNLEIIQPGEEGLIDCDVAIEKLKEKAKKRKGRGCGPNKLGLEGLKLFESITDTTKDPSRDIGDAQRSTDGWILIVTRIHEEAHEDDVHGRFCDYGGIRSLHLNLNRRTGFLKGYALIEYENFKEALAAKIGMDGSDLLGNVIKVDWAFAKKPLRTHLLSSSKQ